MDIQELKKEYALARAKALTNKRGMVEKLTDRWELLYHDHRESAHLFELILVGNAVEAAKELPDPLISLLLQLARLGLGDVVLEQGARAIARREENKDNERH